MADDGASNKPPTAIRQFINILEQLPRLCSPTICGTLSQPTTRAERVSRGADMFEWSLEQKAILSPANITADVDGTDDWQTNVAELNPSWRQHESDRFFSQKTIAPSPMVATPARRVLANFSDLMYDEEEEDRHGMEQEADDDDDRIEEDDADDDYDGQIEEQVDEDHNDHDETIDDDNLLFSPQPLASSQSQQNMDVFSPNSFVRVIEDDNTLQSTPKTTGSLMRPRNRMRTDVLD